MRSASRAQGSATLSSEWRKQKNTEIGGNKAYQAFCKELGVSICKYGKVIVDHICLATYTLRMSKREMQQFTLQNANQVFKAFADETRLRILHIMVHVDEICVNEIEQALDLPQSKVSRHLAHLKNAGLIEYRREGQWTFYKIADPKTCLESEMIGCARNCFSTVPLLQEDLKNLKGLEDGPKCC